MPEYSRSISPQTA